MSAKKVGDQIYVRRPLDSNPAPGAYRRGDWDELTDAERDQILAQEEQEQDDQDDE